MKARLQRYALETEDWLRYHPLVRGLLSRGARWRDGLRRADGVQAQARSIAALCAAARLATDDADVARLQAEIVGRVGRLDADRLDWGEFVRGTDRLAIHKAAILKPFRGPRERGVIFISFEYEWVKLLRLADRRAFADRYTVVIAPSGSPHNLINYVFPAAFPAPVFTLISNPEDQITLPRVSPKLIVVPLYASSWVNPDRFAPGPRGERLYDLLMVANFAKFKRHQVLFRALRRMPRDLRLLLIGQEQDGRSADTIREMARWYGVEGRFTLLQNESYSKIPGHFCQARASVILSRREGSCVAVAESFFADAPAGVLRGAELGSRVFINDQTGRFLDEANLARDLTALVREADRYQPRRWAEENISCYRSTESLNAALKRHALAEGQEWTADIATLQWAPDPRLVRPEDRDRVAPEWAEIRARFGLEIGPAPVN